MILPIIKECILKLATDPNNCPKFYLGSRAWQNIKADNENTQNFFIYLAQPLTSRDDINMNTGLIETYYRLMFFVGQKIDFNATTEHQQLIADKARLIIYYFQQAIIQDARVSSAKNSIITDMLNEFDLNATGAGWVADICIYNRKPVCLPPDLFPITNPDYSGS